MDEEIIQMELGELKDFRNHTFQIRDDDSMKKLVESIKEGGIATPVIVFRNEDGDLEIVSGHRRIRAARLLGIRTVPVILKRMTREEATMLVGDSNFTCREKILPSEKAFTYKAMLRSIKKRMGNENVESYRNVLAKHVGESSTQVFRYLRLTELIPELLQLVDLGKLGLHPAVELSFLDTEAQKTVFTIYQESGRKPSLAVAKEFHRLADLDQLTAELIRELLYEPDGTRKANDYKLVFHSPQLFAILGKCQSVSERVNRVLRGLLLLERQEQELEEAYRIEQEKERERIQKLAGEGGGSEDDW